MRKRIYFFISLIVGVCNVFAGDVLFKNVPDSSTSIPHHLKEVEIVAKKTEKSITSSSPLYFLNQDKFATSGVVDIADALHRLPGITLRDYGGAGGMKTVSVRGFGASHTAVIYDGVTLSNVQSGTIDLSRYSIDNIQELTLIIGDNDDIFLPVRTVSSSSSLSISSLQSLDSLNVTAQIRTGSWGYINNYLRINSPLSPKTNLNFMTEYTHGDNNYPFRLKNIDLVTKERRNNSKMDAWHSEINFIQKLRTTSSLTSKIYFYDNVRQLPGPVIYYNNVCKEALHDRNVFVQAKYINSLSSRMSLLAIGKFNYSSSFYHDEHGRYPGGILDNRYWQREWYATACLLFQLSRNWAFDYSFDYALNSFNSNLPEDPLPFRHSVLQSATAKFNKKRITITGRVIGSLYFNENRHGESAKDVQKLSPSLSISFQPFLEQNMFVRTSYKNIFRLPTFNESYYDNYGSKDLSPENTDQLNFGLTYSLPNNIDNIFLTITADFYVNHIRDMIVAIPYNMFVWYMTNLDRVRTIGADITSEVKIPLGKKQSIDISANYSFQRAEPRTDPESSEWGKQVAYVPKHSGAASLCWKNPWLDLTIHGSGVSDRFTTNNNLPQTRMKGYMETGFSIRRMLSIKKCQLGIEFQILNLFNTQYEVVANYPMPGRSWRGILKCNF